MFTGVHHVTYLVKNVQEMADYLESNFGLKPERVDGSPPNRGWKSILYRIGPTVVDFFEPIGEDNEMARQLKERGPGVAHVALAVDDVDRAFEHLKSKGNEMVGEGLNISPMGYRVFAIEPSNSHGIYFQIAEGDAS